MYYWPNMHTTVKEFVKDARGFFCGENEYNDMATLALNPQEVSIKVSVAVG